MLRTLLSGSMDLPSFIFSLFAYFVLIMVMLPVHEMAHAFTANRLGDPTPKYNGRLTMNPFAHLDIIGTIMILLVGIGYAKPVPVNPRNFRNSRSGMALTALAGPVSNLLMAVASVGVYRLLTLFVTSELVLYYSYLVLISVFASVNIGLAVFNLIPVPPLDGSKILGYFLPAKGLYIMERYQYYITIIMMILLFSGLFDIPLSFLRNGILRFLWFIFQF